MRQWFYGRPAFLFLKQKIRRTIFFTPITGPVVWPYQTTFEYCFFEDSRSIKINGIIINFTSKPAIYEFLLFLALRALEDASKKVSHVTAGILNSDDWARNALRTSRRITTDYNDVNQLAHKTRLFFKKSLRLKDPLTSLEGGCRFDTQPTNIEVPKSYLKLWLSNPRQNQQLRFTDDW